MPGPLEDSYVYAGTTVLRNHRGLRDPDQLAGVEADVTALALAQLAEQGLPGRYDLAHLQAFHRAIFGDLYPWAGEIRTVAISKPGTLFALPQHIISAATDIFTSLARRNYLRQLDRNSFIEQLDAARASINGDNAPRRGLLDTLVDVDATGRPRTPTELRALLTAIRTQRQDHPPLPRPRDRPR